MNLFLAIDATIIGAISGAIVLIIGAIATAAVKIINAVHGTAQDASVERQNIAQGIGTQIERSTGVQPPNVLQPPPANPPGG